MRGRMDMMRSILAIAGSDSIAGAGIQIDIKTAAAHRVYATCAITAVTAQNTLGVTAIQQVNADVVEAQIEAVFDDVAPDAIKIGMLGSLEVVLAVGRSLARHAGVPVVLDPVLVATSGAALTNASDMLMAMDLLLPLCTLVTPNTTEALALASIPTPDAPSPDQLAGALLARGAGAVLLKGGHALSCDDPQAAIDRLYLGACGEGVCVPPSFSCTPAQTYVSQRVEGEFHGTGCSLSTSIACNLALGLPLAESVARAHDFVFRAISGESAIASRGTSLLNPFTNSPID